MLAYTPHPKQRQIHDCGKRFVAAVAGSRGGKSLAMAREFVRRIYADLESGRCNDVPASGSRRRRPRHQSWICAPVHALLAEPRRRIFEIVEPAGLIESWHEHTGELWLKGGALIEFKSCDDARLLVGSGLQGLWVDEADRVSADCWRGQLRQRLSDHDGWALLSTTPLGRGWIFSDLVMQAKNDPSIEFVHWTTADNPHIPASEIAHAKATLPERYFKREYLASFDAFVGLVFELRDEVHVISEKELRLQHRGQLPPFKRVVAGVDWGVNDPGVILVVGDTGHELIVLDEVYERNKYVHDLTGQGQGWTDEAKRLRQKWGITQFLCDPSRPDNIGYFAQSGLPAYGADNAISDGIQRLSEAMLIRHDGRPGLRILSTCTNLIREMKSMQWAQARDGSVQEKPAPGNDHCVDSARYCALDLRKYNPTAKVLPMRAAWSPPS